MFTKLKNLKSKSKKFDPNTEHVSGKELLFRYWHRVLLGYALCNVVFILISLLFIIGIGASETGSPIVDVPDTTQEIKNNLDQVMQLQRYKDLVQAGAISIDTNIDF